jgi:hypothetical protein
MRPFLPLLYLLRADTYWGRDSSSWGEGEDRTYPRSLSLARASMIVAMMRQLASGSNASDSDLIVVRVGFNSIVNWRRPSLLLADCAVTIVTQGKEKWWNSRQALHMDGKSVGFLAGRHDCVSPSARRRCGDYDMLPVNNRVRLLYCGITKSMFVSL